GPMCLSLKGPIRYCTSMRSAGAGNLSIANNLWWGVTESKRTSTLSKALDGLSCQNWRSLSTTSRRSLPDRLQHIPLHCNPGKRLFGLQNQPDNVRLQLSRRRLETPGNCFHPLDPYEAPGSRRSGQKLVRRAHPWPVDCLVSRLGPLP